MQKKFKTDLNRKWATSTENASQNHFDRCDHMYPTNCCTVVMRLDQFLVSNHPGFCFWGQGMPKRKNNCWTKMYAESYATSTRVNHRSRINIFKNTTFLIKQYKATSPHISWLDIPIHCFTVGEEIPWQKSILDLEARSRNSWFILSSPCSASQVPAQKKGLC